ncbi:MAG: helicase HerA-like domain-containing protein [Pseudomonadota bacterium]
MSDPSNILIGRGAELAVIDLRRANRHGLVAGATGTGKTVTLQILAEGFAEAGVPVFLADVKGDVAGLSQPGEPNPKLVERGRATGMAGWQPQAAPVVFWDLFGEQGHPVRTTPTEMGPVLLARILGLNEVQEGVLTIAFQVADDEGLLLLDLDDLRAILAFVTAHAKALEPRYGRVSAASVGAIQRRLLGLVREGGEHLFGEPALDLSDLLRTDQAGRGYVNVLAADRLMQAPKLYATFLLWLLAELFEQLPEVGDPDKPKLVFFFDEAHLLFDDAPKALVDKIEQVVRLIRSKGVGVYFVTQSPTDVPPDVLGQLGNRIQHALRAFTPKDQRAVRVAAETFRPNPAFATAEVITTLGVGEALVSTLDEKGSPTVVDRVKVRPPASRMGPITPEERRVVMSASPVAGVYDERVDRVSAHEKLAEQARLDALEAEAARMEEARLRPAPSPRARRSPLEAAATSALRSIGTTLGRELARGLLGSLRRR